MIDMDKVFIGPPCKKCGSTLRYIKQGGKCAKCRKEATAKARASKAAGEAASRGVNPALRRQVERLRDMREPRLDGYDI